jgi:glycosyltransferase involved in cell wall biosynthesis
MPDVSVILTSYNCAPYLGDAIESILNQSFSSIELLISDDASTDGSAELASSYAAHDSRVRLFRHERNTGYLSNFNFLLSQATGEFIANQDADDWSGPDRLKQQVEVLGNPRIVLCATGSVFHYPGNIDRVEIPSSCVLEGIQKELPSHPASTMFRRSLLTNVPGMNSYFDGGTSMDRYFYMEMMEGHLGYHIGEPLYHARVRAGSHHRSVSERVLITAEVYKVLADQRRRTGTDILKDGNVEAIAALERQILDNRKVRAEHIRERAVINVDCGYHAEAAKMLLEALWCNPLSLQGWRTAAYLARAHLARSCLT